MHLLLLLTPDSCILNAASSGTVLILNSEF
jgi:hypothetical protein